MLAHGQSTSTRNRSRCPPQTRWCPCRSSDSGLPGQAANLLERYRLEPELERWGVVSQCQPGVILELGIGIQEVILEKDIGHGFWLCPAPLTTPANIPGHDVAFGCERLVLKDVQQLRVALRPWRLLVVQLDQFLGGKLADRLRPAQPARVNTECAIAVNEHIVRDLVVTPTSDQDRRRHVGEDIPGDVGRGETVVQVNSKTPFVTEPADFMKVIETDAMTSHRSGLVWRRRVEPPQTEADLSIAVCGVATGAPWWVPIPKRWRGLIEISFPGFPAPRSPTGKATGN